jgi:hypothetical protein
MVLKNKNETAFHICALHFQRRFANIMRISPVRPSILAVVIFVSGLLLAQGQPKKNEEVPKIFLTAHYVYVEAKDGDSFNPRVLPENRKAIADFQYALQDWKRYIVTAKRREAELVFVVRKGSLASVQGRVGVQGGTNPPGDKGPSQPNERPGVDTGIGGQVGSPDDLLEVYIVNPDGSLQGPMWRHYLRDGLNSPDMLLFQQFKKAIEVASKQAPAKPANP